MRPHSRVGPFPPQYPTRRAPAVGRLRGPVPDPWPHTDGQPDGRPGHPAPSERGGAGSSARLSPAAAAALRPPPPAPLGGGWGRRGLPSSLPFCTPQLSPGGVRLNTRSVRERDPTSSQTPPSARETTSHFRTCASRLPGFGRQKAQFLIQNRERKRQRDDGQARRGALDPKWLP